MNKDGACGSWEGEEEPAWRPRIWIASSKGEGEKKSVKTVARVSNPRPKKTCINKHTLPDY